MGRWRKGSTEKKIRDSLETYFQERNCISIDEAVGEYLDPKTVYQGLIAVKKMKAIFASVKRNFLKEGIPFGCINDMDEWGIPMDEDEFRFMVIIRYKLVKGIVRNTGIFLKSAKRRGFLKDGKEEDVKITRLPSGDEEDEEEEDEGREGEGKDEDTD